MSKNKDNIDFRSVSSDALWKLAAPMSVEIEIGTITKQVIEIEIPKPTKEDIKWAGKLDNVGTAKREKEILKNCEENNIWRIAFMCSVFREKDGDLDWFNPDRRYIYFAVPNRTLLSGACHGSNPKSVALLLQCDGMNINNDTGEYEYEKPLNSSLSNKKHALEILTMLSNFKLHGAKRYINKARTQTMRDLLQYVVDRDNHKEEKVENNKQKLLPAPDVENNITAEVDVIWKKLDNETICKLTGDNDDFRLRKIFNFLSSTVSECNEYLDENNKVTTVSQPIVTPMSKIVIKKEIEQAQKHLKKLNGV